MPAASRLFRMGIGIVLLVASALKLYWRAHSPPQLHAGLLENLTIVLVASAGELCLGSVLVSGLWSPAIRLVLISVFLLFACVALGEVFSGFKTCGCFGSGVHIPPWVMATFDSVAVFCLVRCKHTEKVSAGIRNLQIAIAVMLVAAGSAAAASWELHRPALVIAESEPRGLQVDPFGARGSLVILDPEKLVGKPFLLGSHVDIGPQLTSGACIILLVHHDCDVCAGAVPKYQTAVSTNATIKLAIIELPPVSNSSEPAPWSKSIGLFGQLDTTREWFASTPLALLVKGGIVQAAKDGEQAGTPDARWFVYAK